VHLFVTCIYLHYNTKIDLRLNRYTVKTHNGELVKMYKFHLINTKRMSNKTSCDQVLRFVGKCIFMQTRFLVFTICFFLGTIKLGSTAPESPHWVRACL